MNNNENNIGGSSSGQENGDPKPKQDRPLKKARFAWQVKGKHHLKTDSSENNNNEPSTASDDAHVNDCVPLETKYPQTQMKINFSPFNIADFNMIKNLEAVNAESETYCNECYEIRSYNRSYICRICSHSIYSQNNTCNNSVSANKKRHFKDELPLQEWQALQVCLNLYK